MDSLRDADDSVDYDREKANLKRRENEKFDAKATSSSSSSSQDAKKTEPDRTTPPAAAVSLNNDSKATVDAPVLKPLKLKSDYKPLPSINHSSTVTNSQLQTLTEELDSKRKLVEEQFKLNQQSQKQRKESEVELKKDLTAINKGGVCKTKLSEEEEAQKRAQYMREQRERILLAKKKEREEKVSEEERQSKMNDENNEKLEKLRKKKEREEKGMDEQDILDKQVEDENKRTAMRLALANRMKIGLLTDSINTLTSSALTKDEMKKRDLEQKHWADLDNKLKQMDQMREDATVKVNNLSEDILKNVKSNKKS